MFGLRDEQARWVLYGAAGYAEGGIADEEIPFEDKVDVGDANAVAARVAMVGKEGRLLTLLNGWDTHIAALIATNSRILEGFTLGEKAALLYATLQENKAHRQKDFMAGAMVGNLKHTPEQIQTPIQQIRMLQDRLVVPFPAYITSGSTARLNFLRATQDKLTQGVLSPGGEVALS